MTIDIIDMEKKELIWTGSGTGTIDKSATMEERVSNINYMVGEILAQFPSGTQSDY